ncbi:ATP-binding protein [Cognatishimia sp. F0-27]|uniref:hybrid sensor histidine kinase/response regulator n=1 Tax=Cognatishimia sp. F0-27 TaxID=2816855 RepID=UPI001D0C1231|nr:ATP-binding protein [Cognatishimia sp. F0-27]MCC1491822.1 PAS domain-containing protein [Cognatishimia sp. F0-27]
MPESGLRLAMLSAGGLVGAVGIGMAVAIGLREASQRWQATLLARTLEKDPSYCFVCARDGTIRSANLAARRRFDTESGETLSEALRDLFASAEGVVWRLLQRALQEGSALEDITSHAEGVRVHVLALSDNLSVWRLETDAIRGQGVRREDVPTLSVGRNGVILYMNATARDIIGRRARTVEEIIEDTPLRAGSVHRLITREGFRRALVQMRDTGAGRKDLTLSLIADNEEGHAKSREDSGFDTLPVPLIKVAPDGRLLRANPEATRLLGLEGAEDRNLSEYMEGLGRALTDWLREAAEGRMPHRSEFLRLTRSDREVFVQVTLSRVTEDGQPVLLAVLNDATELKTLETQFAQSQKMQAIGQLAGGVAHDFNNLLTAISGHCDLMLLRHDQGDPDYGDLVQINQNANRAAALVGQLLAFSRKQTMRLEILDLRDTLSDLTHLLNRLVGEKMRLTLRHDPILPPIRGDRRQLEQVMMNLVVNARDAMPDGGEILIETERRVLREKLERGRFAVPPGTYVCVRVIDQGHGIPPDKIEKVFEPFFTTKNTGEGTGLGLSTVYGIVKQSGGYVFVDSTLGQGTQFTLLLPAHEHQAEDRKEPVPVTPRKLPDKGSGVVLLVEDEAPVRAFAARALRLRGYTVVEAETAEDALLLLEDEKMAVDVFVTDVVMPGMDGPTWVRKARERRPDVSVVFVSGYAEDAFGEGQDTIPNSVFLPKPFSLNDLTETVHQQIN